MSDAVNLLDVAEARLSPGAGMLPPGASFGPGGTLIVDGASYGPSQWIPSSGDLAGSPMVPSLAHANGAPNWAFIHQQNSILAQALSATGPSATSRSLARSAPTTAELDELRKTNPVAWDRIQDLTPAEMSGLIIEQSGKDAIVYIPGEGWTTSVNDREGFIDIGIFKEIFISKGGTDNLANFLGITQVPQKAGNWYAFGGLIDFGAPGVPGAGNGTIWFVPNRVLGADMTAFFDYHDRNYYHKNDGGEPTTLADIGKILQVEWGSFMAGISAEGAGPLTLALQMVYSTATTAIGVGTAAWNSVKGLLGPLANLPSGVSLSTLGPLLNAANNPVGAAMALLSPTGALSSALGKPASLTCHRMPPPPPPSGGGEDGILISIGISDAQAAAAGAQFEISAESTDCGSPSGGAASSSGAATSEAASSGTTEAGANPTSSSETIEEAKGKIDELGDQARDYLEQANNGEISEAELYEKLDEIGAAQEAEHDRLRELANEQGLDLDPEGYPILPDEEILEQTPPPEPPQPEDEPPPLFDFDVSTTGPQIEISENGISGGETIEVGVTNNKGEYLGGYFKIEAGCSTDEGCSANVAGGGKLSTPELIEGKEVTLNGEFGFGGSKDEKDEPVGVGIRTEDDGSTTYYINGGFFSGGVNVKDDEPEE